MLVLTAPDYLADQNRGIAENYIRSVFNFGASQFRVSPILKRKIKVRGR